MAGRVHTQADERRSLNPRDQFGRKWSLCIELKTGEPTGGIYPAGWQDPLRTPMHLIRVPKNEDGQAEMGKVLVDFDRWLTEIEHAEQGWYTQLHEIALDKYKAIDPGDVAKLDQDKFLVTLTGPKPFPSSEVLRLAKAGDRRLLGLEPLTAKERALLRVPSLSDLKGPPVEPLPEEPQAPAPTDPTADLTPPDRYQDFLSWVFRNKAVQPGDIAAAARLWNEHRKNLVEA